jgi:3',5'-cyclic AMP phosphodiesterase CpdA
VIADTDRPASSATTPRTLRVAHLSDLHLMGGPIPALRLVNKRLTGWFNLKYRRHAVHRPAHVRALAAEIRRLDVDHVVITGDLSNLALESEFEAVRKLLDDDLQLPADRVSIVPGNHDLYTAGSARKRRFAAYFGAYTTSDLPALAIDHPAGAFPFVRFRGPIALIGLASAVPRPPMIAAGEIGASQLAALAKVLSHPEVARRFPVVLLHHPPNNPASRKRAFTNGLWDAEALRDRLDKLDKGLVLHGHLHERVQRSLLDAGSNVRVVGATSASLEDAGDHKHAGFQVYSFDEGGLVGDPELHMLAREGGGFAVSSMPMPTPDTTSATTPG